MIHILVLVLLSILGLLVLLVIAFVVFAWFFMDDEYWLDRMERMQGPWDDK